MDGIAFTVEDGIGRITLDRPEAGNAITLPLARALLAAAIRCQTDAAIRCIVLTGNGRLFCAGGDVQLLAGAGDKRSEVLSELIATFHAAVARLARAPKPLVTLVNGPAAGAGFSLAMLGDVVIGARSAHFTAAYGAIGLTPDGGLSWLLPRLVGLRKAQDIILTNRRIKAEEAEAIGLVTRIVDDEALVDEGLRVATALADAPMAALAASRALLADSFETGLETQLDRELRSMAAAGAGQESEEGLSALLAKRPANFRGV
ncbi:enoyl-CoA hydratase/isomerase family protein [Sphingobium sp. SA2]|jgi:2-(1,2-epoxy-1,2-dihydrophenyl)acetyl-CoA isomerase|uniref:enoyl-CoA hydratase/isomerase family protein n=1 Tax=unclassified Sphingobium TaxID=2611147 RepID=UPI0004FF79C5|nr:MULTISPECIES: enoyl-CoA hydratase/isomerase family protein [unclassified Sphingobium]KFL45220.1 enoyl-CoA hydratase [Sphingobium sp. ba1]MDT7532637.1 enoyl-CoA hydratase/isomerase family protein [Sphingobium sp. SA2]